MANHRFGNDPRTVARDFPGLFDALFPQLVPGVVAHFNRRAIAPMGCEPVPTELIAGSGLQMAMLFEAAVAAAEQLMDGATHIDWQVCLEIAVSRQRRHFDARLPTDLNADARAAAQWTARNLVLMLHELRGSSGGAALARSPFIPGYQWIASGVGDFSCGASLVEVKCTNQRFAASDYRQIVMYWLLSYASAVESDAMEWSEGVLLNPRTCIIVRLSFDEIISVISAGRSKVELLEMFAAMVGDQSRLISVSHDSRE